MTAWYELRAVPSTTHQDEESRKDEDDAGDGENGEVEYVEVIQLQSSDREWTKQEVIAFDDKHGM